MTTEQKVAVGTRAEELRDMADKLIAKETDLGTKWRNDEDRERYAKVLRLTADLVDAAPCISLSASLETKYREKDCHQRRSPMLVVGHAEVKNTKNLEPWNQVAQQALVQATMIEKQIESFCDQINADRVGFLCTLICDQFDDAKTSDEEREIRYTILKELRSILGGHIQLTEKGKKEQRKEAGKRSGELLAELLFGALASEDDDDDDDEDDDEPCDRCEECGCDDDDDDVDEVVGTILKHKQGKGDVDIIKLEGEAAEKVAKALIGEIVKGGKDGDCTGGKCKKSRKKD